MLLSTFLPKEDLLDTFTNPCARILPHDTTPEEPHAPSGTQDASSTCMCTDIGLK